MGAPLFRRDVLSFVEFRSGGGRCECRCCSDDLRRAGFGIGYLPAATARHEPGLRRRDPTVAPPPGPTHPVGRGQPPRVLTAFDRKHFGRFRGLFLETFRASGNRETVVAVTYGLYPSEIQTLRATPGVEVVNFPEDELVVPARRLR